MWSAVLTLALYSSAKIAEHVRAGLNAVGGGIRMAARSTGLSWGQTQRFVVLPLLLRVIAPSLTSEFVTIFKGSSLAMMVGVAETAYVTQELGTETFHWVEANTLGTGVYLVCAWVDCRADGRDRAAHARAGSDRACGTGMSVLSTLAALLVPLVRINLIMTLTAVAIALPASCLVAAARLSPWRAVHAPVTAYVNCCGPVRW